jgi:hypothetical protein
MKKALYGAISILALAIAAPATAQTSGTVTGGIGAGLGLGGFTNGAIDTSAVNGTNSQTLDIKIDREMSAASGSGFGGSMDINSLPAGSSFAVVGGAGTSGTSINANVDAANNGTITSTSFNAGLYGGLTSGNAALSMQVMNFGQSSADFKLTTNFNAEHQDEFNNTTLDWTAAGAAGLTGFAFGSLGWNID